MAVSVAIIEIDLLISTPTCIMWSIHSAPLFNMTSSVPAASNLHTVSDLPIAANIQAAVKTGLQAVADALSKHQLQLSHMTFLRICTPRYSSGPPLHTAGILPILSYFTMAY